MLSKLKEAYDNTFKKKIRKGEAGEERESDVTDIAVNFIGAGSSDSMDKDTQKVLSKVAVTGLFRRSLVVDSKFKLEKNNEPDESLDRISEHFNSVDNKWKNNYNDRLDNVSKTGCMETVFLISDEARDTIELIDDKLIARANADELNQFNQFDVGSLNMIVNIAYISSYIEGGSIVEKDHIMYAWNLFLKTRETALSTFNEVRPHNDIFEILHKKGNLTHSELMDISQSDCIPKAKNQFNDVMLLVQELCYRNGEELIIGSGIVIRYSIRKLPETNLDKLIMSWSTDGKREKSIAFEAVEFKWKSVEKLAKSKYREELDEETGEIESLGVDSFTTTHYDSSPKTDPYGHRRAESAVQGQNIIAFDIDDGMRIETAIELLKSFTYCIYTTRSHQSEKGEYGDRFRIIIPTKTKFHCTPEQHKIMYENASVVLGLTTIDSSVKNVSRLFFTNSNADVYMNEGELFDVAGCLPDTNQNDKVMKILQSVARASYSEDKDAIQTRIDGYVRYAILSIDIGNLKNKIYNLWMFMIDMTGDKTKAEETLWYVQQQRGFPERFLIQFLSDHK